MKYLTIGIDEITREGFNNVINEWVKPMGGLWASPYIEDGEYMSAWHEWCSNESPRFLKSNGVIFELKEEAKIYTIDTYADLEKLHEKYPLKSKYSDRLGKNFLDFEAISKDYDVIYLTEMGQWRTRLSFEIDLYGWDVECILVLNYDSIGEGHKTKVERRAIND